MPPTPDVHSGGRRGAVLHAVGVVVAVALSGAAAWLIVTGTTRKDIEIGVLLGLWGALVGGYSMFARHRPGAGSAAGHELQQQRPDQVETLADVAARRQWEYRLEEMLRRQIQAAVAAELQGLRAEVAALRSELSEKLGGQVQLEHIDITRVIGFDPAALQQEVRELKAAREYGADRVPAVEGGAGPPAAAALQGTEPEPVVHSMPDLAPAAPDDPFAAMPRLTRFTDIDLDADPDEAVAEAPAGRHASARHAVSEVAHAGGRRRRRPDAGQDVLARVLQREGLR